MGKFFLVGLVAATFASPHIALAAPADPATLTVGAQPMSSPAELIAYGTLKPSPLITRSSARSTLVIGGLVGALVDISEGQNIAKKNDIRDPAAAIARSLAQTLADRRGAVLLETPLDFGSMKPDEVAKASGQADYIVDVVTRQRDMWWYSMKWNRYFITYQAHMNLLEGRTGTILAYDRCTWKTAKEAALTRDELLKDGAKELKAQFDIASAACLAQFETKIMALTLRPTRTVKAEPPTRASPSLVTATAPPPISTPSQISGVFQGALTTLAPPREPITPHQAKPTIPPLTAPPAAIEASSSYSEEPRLSAPRPSLPEAPRKTQLEHEALPAYVEYPYARPYAEPPSRTPPPEYRYAGRDANGYLVWPGKRP